jgi:hypothetical protein
VPDPIRTVDGLLAATALVHDHVLMTRNIRDAKAPALGCSLPRRKHGDLVNLATA